MSSELSINISSIHKDLSTLPQEYTGMLSHIREGLPAVERVTENFYKSGSQFKNVTLDITDLTPISSVKHILASINKTKMALTEAQLGRKKTEINLKKKQKELETIEDEFDRELCQIEIIEMMSGLKTSEDVMKGAIRKLSFLMTQYQSVMDHLGKDHLTEEDYEREERRYHIMTAFKQALNSSRPRQGVMDEGNSIYMFELGINVGHAQAEILNYLRMEHQLFQEGKVPTHEMTIKWLEACADLFENCPEKFAESRGFKVLDQKSLAAPEPYKSIEASKTEE
jgi:hypothetical protein